MRIIDAHPGDPVMLDPGCCITSVLNPFILVDPHPGGLPSRYSRVRVDLAVGLGRVILRDSCSARHGAVKEAGGRAQLKSKLSIFNVDEKRTKQIII